MAPTMWKINEDAEFIYTHSFRITIYEHAQAWIPVHNYINSKN